MQLTLNRNTLIGLSIALLTTLTALTGGPQGFSGFRLPIWELLLQLNLCTGFIFLILGVLESVETPVPDLRPALKLMAAAFVTYMAVFAANASARMPLAPQLFLFALSLACVAAGWGRMGFTLFRMLDVAD
jgi:hypothetical protein